MNENPWANAAALKKTNAPNAAVIRFINPKVANRKTVDLTLIIMIAGRVPQKINYEETKSANAQILKNAVN